MIFKIGDNDFTRCIVAGTAAINDVDIATATWTDANGKTHKAGITTKAQGTVDLHLRDDDYLSAFREAIAGTDDGGILSVTACINNKGTERTFDAFLTAAPAEGFIGNRQTLADFTVTVEEA